MYKTDYSWYIKVLDHDPMQIKIALLLSFLLLLIHSILGCVKVSNYVRFNAIQHSKSCQQPKLPSYTIYNARMHLQSENAEIIHKKICLLHQDIYIISDFEHRFLFYQFEQFVNKTICKANDLIRQKIPRCYILTGEISKLYTYYFLQTLSTIAEDPKFKVSKGRIVFADIICNERSDNIAVQLNLFTNKNIYVLFTTDEKDLRVTNVGYYLQ